MSLNSPRVRVAGLRVVLALWLFSITRPASADLYSMFVMSLEFVVDSSDVIVLADAVPHGQRFELQQTETLRNLTDETVPWPLDGAQLLTDRQREGHLQTIPVVLFARMDESLGRLRVFHHVWLKTPDQSQLKLPFHELIHCLPHSDSGSRYQEFRWPVCLAVDGRRRLLTDPATVLRLVNRRIARGVSDQRPGWEMSPDVWHTFGYYTFENAKWFSAMEFDGDDTSWNILMPDDDSTKRLIARELDAGIYRYGWFQYLKQFADEPEMLARIQRGLHADEPWIQWECSEILKELGIPEAEAPSSVPFVPFVAFGFAVLASGLACSHRWTASVGQ